MKCFRLAALGVVLVVAVLVVGAAPALAGSMPMTNIPYDATPQLKNMPVPHQNHPITLLAAAAGADVPTHDGRPADLVLTLYSNDPAHPGAYDVPFWKEYAGEHSDIYVGWNDLASPPESLQQDQTITADQVTYIGKEFDKRIWESDVFHFGTYQPRSPAGVPDFDGKRAAIFVHNIRDEAYYGPFRYYIAGFFASGLNDLLGLNAIFIDSYNWKDRIGPDSARPYLYEGTVAHEFQHLIHHDVHPSDADFIDEGMADQAEQFLYGSKTTDSHIGEYLYYHRDSLIDWKGELFDYGNAVLWQDYLWEQVPGYAHRLPLGAPLADRVTAKYANNKFADTDAKFVDPGDEFTWNLIHSAKAGLPAIADMVGGMGAVERLHRNYTIANLLDGKVADPKYNYTNLALGGPDSAGYTIDQGIAYYDSKVNGNMPPTRKNVRRNTGVEPWGGYYRAFAGSSPGFTMTFKGNASDGISPFTGTYEWYAGMGNMLQRTLTRQIDGVAADSTLSFMTWFDIEQDWDYGYVEASTDGQTWTILPQTSALTVGVTNVNGSSAWGGAGGFTGLSNGWQPATFSLAGFSGTVYLRFRYATDEASNGQGWYVDDIKVGDAFDDPADTTNGWQTDGWLFTTGLQQNDWSCDAFAWNIKAQSKSWLLKTVVSTDGVGVNGSAAVSAQFQKNGIAYGILANRPDGTFSSLGKLTILKGQLR